MSEIKLIPLDQIIHPADHLRLELKGDTMSELIESIKSQGIINPVVLNKKGEKYEIIAGVRRVAAAEYLRLPAIQAIVLSVGDDDAQILRLHENLFREDLNPIEESEALLVLERKYHFTREKIASMLNKSKAWVTQRIDILNWDDRLKKALSGGLISYSVARELSRITVPSDLKRYLETTIESGVNARTAARWVADWIASQTKPVPAQVVSAVKEDESGYKIITCFACGKNQAQSGQTFKEIILCPDCAEAIQLEEQSKT